MPVQIILGLILGFGFLIKLPALAVPFVGHFGSYQSLNGMMAEMMIRSSFRDLLLPQTYLILNGQPSLHLIYYPFGSLTAAVLATLFGGNLDFWGRFQAAFFMLAAGRILFEIAKRKMSESAALWAAAIFTFSPQVLISGLCLQNEAAAIFFLLAAFWFVIQEKDYAKFTAGMFFSLALISRLHFLFVLPALGLFCWKENKLKNILLLLSGVTLPAMIWFGYTYHLQQTQGSHVITSLFSQAGEGRVLAAGFLTDKEFYKRVFDILTGLWVTPALFAFIPLSFFSMKRTDLPFLFWLLGSLGTVFLLPQKTFDHPFYLIAGIPAAALLMAPVLDRLFFQRRKMAVVFTLLYFFCSLKYYLPPAFSGGADMVRIPAIGKRVQQLTEKDDLVAASHGSSCDLLYYSDRKGWTFDLEMQKSVLKLASRANLLKSEGGGDPVRWLEELRGRGARYLVVSEPGVLSSKKDLDYYLRTNYRVVSEKTDSFLLFDLKDKIL